MESTTLLESLIIRLIIKLKIFFSQLTKQNFEYMLGNMDCYEEVYK